MRSDYLRAALLPLLILLAAACAGEGESPAPAPTNSPTGAAGFPLTITDSNGEQVILETPPRRIVALAPSFAEVLFAVGAGDAVVAVDENTDYPPQAAAVTKISGFQPSVEGIAGLEPDLVVIFFDPGDLQSSLQALGISVLFLATPATVEGVLEQIELLGRAAGHGGEAIALADQMRAEIAAVAAELDGLGQGPRVFHELDPTLFTTCPGEFTHDLYVILNAQNIAQAAGGLCQMSQEAVIQADPEVIVLADEPAGESPQTVAARPGWESISAVRQGRVHTVDPDVLSRPGPRLSEAVRTLARLLYPERFP